MSVKLHIVLLMLLLILSDSYLVGGAKDSDDEEIQSFNPKTGKPARRGAFPHTAAILRDGRQFCGGTLIRENIILTAANCVSFLNTNDISKIRVHLNTVVLKTYNPGAIISQIVKFRFHEKYNKTTHQNDIALIQLADRITTLYPLALPDSEDLLVGQHGVILHWEETKSGSKVQEVLLQANATVISNTECAKTYDTDIFDSSLCALSAVKEEGICQDDSSGGPMIIDGRQVGVISWGKGCMDSKYPGVYTRISSYKNWINYTIAAM